ncbi:MAG TPA: DNA polymerase III subunit gamma/tau [Bacteroidales bacterium]|nr:DNA polymerase III subunit gamma/tau [Bacteroidales bacterium]
MDSFIVSARKYRPITFDTVVGQKAITNTLKNAIRTNHVAQAFVFTGPRGVGKTTCARILAKTINCENLDDRVEACNQCIPCREFDASNAFNVHELDAASNNSVDGIRTLVEQVRIPPQIGKYKVYIIDEVHMLSNQAFNAFLKTLEEPPKYAKFILATTEKHKIIPTILSRCQIFDFARITVDDIVSHLQFVAQSEGVTADRNALHIIAQKADGAMRDSLSIFDQMVSFSGNQLTYKQVIENLNVLDYDYYFKLTDMLLQEQTSDFLILINEIIYKGFDGSEFLTGFGEHLRNLLLCQNQASAKLIEVSGDLRDKYLQQAKICPPEFLLKALELNSQADLNYKESSNKRLTIELAFLQMAAYIKKKSPDLTDDLPGLPPIQEEIPNTSYQPTKDKEAISKVSVVSEPLPGSPPVSFHEPQKAFEAENGISKPVVISKTTPSKHTGMPVSLKINEKPTPIPEEKEAVQSENHPRDKFSSERFHTAWKAMTEMYEQESQSLFVALTNHEPSLSPAGMITVMVENAVQQKMIQDKKADLLEFLRKELNNFGVQLETSMVEHIRQQKAYLPKEKLEKMIEKNPVVSRLCKELDLDVMY